MYNASYAFLTIMQPLSPPYLFVLAFIVGMAWELGKRATHAWMRFFDCTVKSRDIVVAYPLDQQQQYIYSTTANTMSARPVFSDIVVMMDDGDDDRTGRLYHRALTTTRPA